MGFGPGGKHWCALARLLGEVPACVHAHAHASPLVVRRYEDTQAAASKTEGRHRVVMWTCIGFFAFGLWAVQSSSARDKAAKERGDLVDVRQRGRSPPRPALPWHGSALVPAQGASDSLSRLSTLRRRRQATFS